MANTDKVRFKFFIPDARVLGAEEVASLPPEKKEKAAGKDCSCASCGCANDSVPPLR